MRSRIILVVFGISLGILVTEFLLHAFDQPRFYKMHTHPPQFSSIILNNNDVFYINAPSQRIRFIYDGNPRGYFGKENEVDHITNSWGFRGNEFVVDKPENIFRIAFLGDSFTFGEGVRFEDTYSEQVAYKLSKKFKVKGIKFESYNFAVGGYNTEQELFLLRNVVLQTKPDMVVLGYTLNDVEPSLLKFDKLTGNVIRNPVEESNFEGIDEAPPPDKLFFKLRIVKLIWKYFDKERASRKTIQYYKSLYEKDKKGWLETKKALYDIINICKENNILCYVVCFPVMHRLNNSYPFLSIHSAVQKAVEDSGGIFIDLFPLLKGKRDIEIWTHPTDQHPNEKVHEIAAGYIVDKLVKDSRLKWAEQNGAEGGS